MAKRSNESRAPDDGIAEAKRIMERLVNMPPKLHKDTKPDEPAPGKPRRGRPKKESGASLRQPRPS
jgi:hypothetical protein